MAIYISTNESLKKKKKIQTHIFLDANREEHVSDVNSRDQALKLFFFLEKQNSKYRPKH